MVEDVERPEPGGLRLAGGVTDRRPVERRPGSPAGRRSSPARRRRPSRISGWGSGVSSWQPSIAFTSGYGLTALPPCGWISKCRWFVPLLPVLPTTPTICPALTFGPDLDAVGDAEHVGVEEVGAVGHREPHTVAGERTGVVGIDLRDRAVRHGVEQLALRSDDVDAEVHATTTAGVAPAVAVVALALDRERLELRPWPGRAPSARARRSRPSFSAVASLTLPVTLSPLARWKSMTAALVPPPKSPSTPPRTVMPALTSADCSAITRAPFSP